MRQQYHHRKVGAEMWIWNVHTLVELARDLPIIEVEVAPLLAAHEHHWFDESSPPATPKDIAQHAKLIEDCDLNYPIILCADGGVMDGMHRICKAWNLRMPSIKAVRFRKTPVPDYINVDIKLLPYD